MNLIDQYSVAIKIKAYGNAIRIHQPQTTKSKDYIQNRDTDNLNQLNQQRQYMEEEPPLEDGDVVLTQREFQFQSAKVIVAFPAIVCNSSKFLRANISMIPKANLMNAPLEVELRGCSSLQNLSSLQSKKQSALQITQSCLNERQDKMQAKLMSEFKYTERNKQSELAASRETQQIIEDGEYFLQGCLVLYQLDEEKQQRTDVLLSDKIYKYPVQFILPTLLPVSLSSVLLKNIHISIKYTLEIKLTFCKVEGRKTELQTAILPFCVEEEPKTYPFQELVLTQKLRLYHEAGKKEDELLKSKFTKCIRCLCPNCIFDLYASRKDLLSTRYQRYDLYYLQLLAVVNRDQSIFFTVRAFKDPESQQLTMNRDKKPKEGPGQSNVLIKQVKSMSEVPHDVSLVSIKQTDRKPAGLTVQRVQVKMWGEISNVCKQVIFTKTIYLNNYNYDMVEGECIVQLGNYLQYPKTCHNELFSFSYSFTMTAFFNEEEGQNDSYSQMFVVEEIGKQLVL